MVKTNKYLLLLFILMTALAAAACSSTGNGAKSEHGVPLPGDARLINNGDTMGLPKKAWGAVYASDLTMKEAADWYEARLKEKGWDYEKLPEKPEDEGYTIFNVKGNQPVKLVLVDDGNKKGANIQLSGRK